MEKFVIEASEKLYNKTEVKRTKKREEMLKKRRFKALPIEKKIEVIKERFGLSHGGGKKHKKRRGRK